MKIFKKRKLSEEIEKYDNYRLAEVLELKDDIQPVADVAQADAFKSIKKLDKRAEEAFKEVEKNAEPVVKSTHNRNLGIVDKTDAMKKMGLVESFNKKFPSVDYSISHKNKDRFLKVCTESLDQAKSISTWASGNKIPCYIRKGEGVYSCVLKEEWVDEDACLAGIAQDLNYLIKDELEAVDGYNSVLATWKDADKFPEVIAVLKDIVDEEMLHIGQLQRALELVSPNAKNIQAGAKEAEEQIVGEAEKQKEKEIEKAEEKFRDKIDVEVEDSIEDIEDGGKEVEDIEDGEKEVVDIDVVEESLDDEKVNKTLKSARKLEDVEKLPNGKWANVGKDGKADSGTFKTKKEAESQMRAMYANGYKESIKKEGMKDTLDAYVKGETLEERYEPYSSFKTFEYKDETEQGYEVVKVFRDLDDDRVHIIFYRTKPGDYNIGLGYSLDKGVWNQGRYNFGGVKDAEEFLKREYNVEDLTDTFKEKKIEVNESLKKDLEEEKIEKGPFQVIWYVMEDDHPRCECFKEKEKAIEYCNNHKEDKDKLEMQAVEVNDKDEIVDYLVL